MVRTSRLSPARRLLSALLLPLLLAACAPAASAGDEPPPPGDPGRPAAVVAEEKPGVAWSTDIDAAFARAAEASRPLAVVFR